MSNDAPEHIYVGKSGYIRESLGMPRKNRLNKEDVEYIRSDSEELKNLRRAAELLNIFKFAWHTGVRMPTATVEEAEELLTKLGMK